MMYSLLRQNIRQRCAANRGSNRRGGFYDSLKCINVMGFKYICSLFLVDQGQCFAMWFHSTFKSGDFDFMLGSRMKKTIHGFRHVTKGKLCCQIQIQRIINAADEVQFGFHTRSGTFLQRDGESACFTISQSKKNIARLLLEKYLFKQSICYWWKYFFMYWLLGD